MTRTERSFSPRAVIRDRSESKSGLDKSDRKGGAGAHNWGSLEDEQAHEFLAYEDNNDEGLVPDAETERELGQAVSEGHKPAHDGSLNERRSSATSDKERQEARAFRAKALKEGTDLGAIARTSAGASSPPRHTSTVTITTDAQTGVTL